MEKMNFEDSTPKVETYLNDWDRNLLKEGGKKIVDMMLLDFKGNLPDAIVLPDTSARPLYYFLRPIVEKLESKGIKKPEFYFLKTRTPGMELASAERDNGTYGSTEEFIEQCVARGGFTAWDIWVAERYEIEEMGLHRSNMKKRFDEIRQYAQDGKMAVIDDYSSDNSDTLHEIRRASQDKKIPHYSIFSSSDTYARSGKKFSLYEDDKGVYNPHPYKPDLSFSYRGEDAVGVTKKDFSQYARPLQGDAGLAERKKQLRKELEQVGKEVASEFDTYHF